jgi:hypothetical protein
VCWLGSNQVVLKKTTFLGPTTAGPNVADYYVGHPGGSGLSPLTMDGLEEGSTGACVPTTRTFFFTRADGEHFWIPADGGSPIRLPLTGGTIQPSPDGRLLAWLNDAGLLVVTTDDTLSVRKLADPIGGSSLIWSPDSKELAFWDGVVSVATGRVRPLEDGSPILWSPDGTKMLIACSARATCLANADGTCRSGAFDSSPLGAHNFAWQPVPGGMPSPPFRCADVRVTGNVGASSVLPEEVETLTFTIRSQGNETADDVRLESSSIGGGVTENLSSSSEGRPAMALRDRVSWETSPPPAHAQL